MKMEELKPEFFEQVIRLRRRILYNVKPKKINGVYLNGSMFIDLLEQYVTAINQGSIPNIENAWSYICKNECYKAHVESLKLYQQTINDILYNKLPLQEVDLLVIIPFLLGNKLMLNRSIIKWRGRNHSMRLIKLPLGIIKNTRSNYKRKSSYSTK